MTTDSLDRHEDCGEYRRRRWEVPVSRRHALAGTLGIVALGAVGSHILLDGGVLERLGAVHPGAGPQDKVLIVIQQSGGNDGLNTVVPYANTLYYKRRPTLAVKLDHILPLGSSVGLHPNLKGIKRIWDRGDLAVVQGVGYPNPNLSHFESIIYWQTGDTTGTTDSGWLGRYLDASAGDGSNPLRAISIGDTLPLAFRSHANATPAVTRLPDFQLPTDSDGKRRLEMLRAFREMNSEVSTHPTYAAIQVAQRTTIQAVDRLHTISTGYRALAHYPRTDLARQLQLVAQLIHAGLGTRVFWVQQDGYDDHVREQGDHARLLHELDGAVSGFYSDLRARSWDHKVMTMTWSEFGRRVEENGDRGTDHGTAAPMLIMGGGVKGGIYGEDPVLTRLDGDGNLKYQVDFRSVYTSILDGWLGADAGHILNARYDSLPFV